MSKRGIIITDPEELQLIMNWRTRDSQYRMCVSAISHGIDADKYFREYKKEETVKINRGKRKAAGSIISFSGSRRTERG